MRKGSAQMCRPFRLLLCALPAFVAHTFLARAFLVLFDFNTHRSVFVLHGVAVRLGDALLLGLDALQAFAFGTGLGLGGGEACQKNDQDADDDNQKGFAHWCSYVLQMQLYYVGL